MTQWNELKVGTQYGPYIQNYIFGYLLWSGIPCVLYQFYQKQIMRKKKDLSIIGFIFPISLYILKTTMYLLVIYYGRVTLCVI